MSCDLSPASEWYGNFYPIWVSRAAKSSELSVPQLIESKNFSIILVSAFGLKERLMSALRWP